ncbi:MAG: hypothetical protein ACK5WS_01105 [Alphaproteobacteria bacterium]|jgi:hypothetical protein
MRDFLNITSNFAYNAALSKDASFLLLASRLAAISFVYTTAPKQYIARAEAQHLQQKSKFEHHSGIISNIFYYSAIDSITITLLKHCVIDSITEKSDIFERQAFVYTYFLHGVMVSTIWRHDTKPQYLPHNKFSNTILSHLLTIASFTAVGFQFHAFYSYNSLGIAGNEAFMCWIDTMNSLPKIGDTSKAPKLITTLAVKHTMFAATYLCLMHFGLNQDTLQHNFIKSTIIKTIESYELDKICVDFVIQNTGIA